MRWRTFLLVAALLGLGGYGLMRLVGPGPVRRGLSAPERPPALEEAWRAHLGGRASDLGARLEALRLNPPSDPRAQDEVRLLRAHATGDVPLLTQLAEGQGVANRAVVAAAQRALARGSGGPALRERWSVRFARDFPGSWASSEVAAGMSLRRPAR